MLDGFRKNDLFEPLDSQLVLSGEGSVDNTTSLQDFFEKCHGQRSLACNDANWVEQYNKFVNDTVSRRRECVEAWLEANLQQRLQDHQEIAMIKSELRELLYLPLCKKSCNNNQCSLPCLKNQHEESEGHDCKTDHKCHFRCEIKEAHPGDEELPICNYPAGHRNRHRCKTRHACMNICKYNNGDGCLSKCSKEVDHEGEHLCNASEHYCGKPCSLSKPGLYECMGTCAISVGIEHKEHKCDIDECNRLCQSNAFQHGVENHFYGLTTDLEPNKQIHNCKQECEKPGICKVDNIINIKTYTNEFNRFDYEEVEFFCFRIVTKRHKLLIVYF